MRPGRGSRALVTGAAGGIGRAVALELSGAGADLWLMDRDADGLERVAEDARRDGVAVVTDTADLTRTDDIARTVDRVGATWGALHLLINNAGTCYYGPTREMTDAQWERILDLNLHAPIRLIRGLLPLLEASPEAHVANICSMYGLVSYRKQAAYQATKFGLVGLTLSLRAEYAGSGLGFSAICPGFVRGTNFFDAMEVPPEKESKRPPWLITCTAAAVARRTLAAIRRDRAIVNDDAAGSRPLDGHPMVPARGMDGIQQFGFGFNKRRKRKAEAAQRRSGEAVQGEGSERAPSKPS